MSSHSTARRLFIQGGTIVTMNPRRDVLERGDLLIEDGRIAAVGPDLHPPSDARRVDAAGAAVIPGLINAHTHLFQTLLRGVLDRRPFAEWLARIYATGALLTPEDCLVAAQLGAAESLLGGVTTLVEHHFAHPALELVEATMEALRGAGIRAVVARTAMDEGDLVPDPVRETPAQATAACAELLRRHRPDPMMGVMVGGNTPGVSCSGEMAVAMHRFALENGLRVTSHCAEAQAVVAAVRRRHDAPGVIAWLARLGVLGPHFLAAHAVHLANGEVRTLADTRTAVAHNPVSNMYLGDGAAPVLAMRRAGVVVALGTDGAASNNTQDMFEVMKASLLLQRVVHQDPAAIGAEDALEMATIGGARALGMDEAIGSLEPGKRADLAVVDLRRPHLVAVHDVVSQLVYCARAADVRMTVVDGRAVMEDRRVVSLDVEKVMDAGQRRGRSLGERSPRT